ncbi:MAG: hypothetical protein KF855_00880 [Acidobacteria bacterium]|nr:hypothetical protein [Acidobacteriota bacterium]
MKGLLAILFLVLPLAAQTKVELDSKYDLIQDNLYRIKPGIALEVAFSDTGKAKAFRIFPDDPKNKDSFPSIEVIRGAIRELVGSRACRVPLRSTRVNISCSLGKGCYGVKEEWKSLTTLMAWHEETWLYATMSLHEEPEIPPPGRIKLLPGYIHLPGCGIDTSVGSIKIDGGMEIRYDIGHLTDNFASRYANTNSAEWTKTEYVRDDSVLIVLTKERRIIASFEKASANFSAKIASQADIDDFLKMVLTY